MKPAIKLNFKKAFYMAYLQLYFFKKWLLHVYLSSPIPPTPPSIPTQSR